MTSLKVPGLIAYAWCKSVGSSGILNATTYQVEPINVGFLDPFFHVVCYLRRCTDGCGTETTDGDMLTDRLLGPFRDAR